MLTELQQVDGHPISIDGERAIVIKPAPNGEGTVIVLDLGGRTQEIEVREPYRVARGLLTEGATSRAGRRLAGTDVNDWDFDDPFGLGRNGSAFSDPAP